MTDPRGTDPSADPFFFDDAAYVLGLLAPDEQRAFELHLLGCAACRARVAEIGTVPALLAGVSAAELADDPPPETLLPGLLRRARQRRGRQRILVGGLAAVAAACLVALAVAVWPGSGLQGTSQPPAQALHAVVTNPVQASARLVDKSWGTEIELHCRYAEGVAKSYPYQLVVVDRSGHRQTLGSWRLGAESDITYTAGTSLSRSDIALVQVTLTDGRPILQLRL